MTAVNRVRFLYNPDVICGVVTDSPYATAVLADSPMAYWQCQDAGPSTSTTPVDTSGNGHHMTSVNSPDGIYVRQFGALTSPCDFGMIGVTPTTGIVPNASVNTFSSAVSNLTVSFWLYGPLDRWAHAGFSPDIVSNGSRGTDGWAISVPNIPVAARLTVLTWNSGSFSGTGSSSLMSSTDWYHIACICSSGTWRILINGALDVTLGTPTTPSTPTDSFRFDFNYALVSPVTTPGPISHVAYWDSALTNGQIAAHYAAR